MTDDAEAREAAEWEDAWDEVQDAVHDLTRSINGLRDTLLDALRGKGVQPMTTAQINEGLTRLQTAAAETKLTQTAIDKLRDDLRHERDRRAKNA